MSELLQFQREVGEWADKMFNAKRGYSKEACTIGIINHLKKEVVELAEDKNKEEVADCFLLLLHFAWLHGFDLLVEAKKKLDLNKEREWGDADEFGVVEHIKKGLV